MLRSICAAGLLCVMCAANGATAGHYVLDLKGAVVHRWDGWECLDLPDMACPLQPGLFDWLGTLSIDTPSDADGTYSGAELTLSMASKLVAFTTAGADTSRPNDFAQASVLIRGSVVSIDGQVILSLDSPVTEIMTFCGLTIQYDQLAIFHHGQNSATAQLREIAPVQSPVPESTVSALLLAGLGALALRKREHRITECIRPSSRRHDDFHLVQAL